MALRLHTPLDAFLQSAPPVPGAEKVVTLTFVHGLLLMHVNLDIDEEFQAYLQLHEAGWDELLLTWEGRPVQLSQTAILGLPIVADQAVMRMDIAKALSRVMDGKHVEATMAPGVGGRLAAMVQDGILPAVTIKNMLIYATRTVDLSRGLPTDYLTKVAKLHGLFFAVVVMGWRPTHGSRSLYSAFRHYNFLQEKVLPALRQGCKINYGDMTFPVHGPPAPQFYCAHCDLYGYQSMVLLWNEDPARTYCRLCQNWAHKAALRPPAYAESMQVDADGEAFVVIDGPF